MRFTIRVELFDTNDGTSEEYDILHKAMEAAGFSRTIVGNDGVKYHLPPAEYNVVGEFTPENVRQAACDAAAKTGKKYSVLVTPSDGRYWQNLKPVKVAHAS